MIKYLLISIGCVFFISTLFIACGASQKTLNMEDEDLLDIGHPTPVIERVPPAYPRQAIWNRTEGKVFLVFDITPTGDVTNIRVLRSRPRGVFDAAAMKALSQWKFKPKIEDGAPVEQDDVGIVLSFKLKRGGLR